MDENVATIDTLIKPNVDYDDVNFLSIENPPALNLSQVIAFILGEALPF